MDLELEVDAVAGVLVVAAHGELTAGRLDALRECLAKAIEAARTVVLDCLEVAALDGEGIRLLREAHGRLGTRLRVVAERGGPIHRALKEAGLAHVLALHNTLPSALAAAATTGRLSR